MNMKIKRDLSIPFAMAVLLHAVGVVCADRIFVVKTGRDALMPGFQQGASSLAVTFFSSDSKPEEPAPQKPRETQPSVSIPEGPAPNAKKEELVAVAVVDKPDLTVDDAPKESDVDVEPEVVAGPEIPGQKADADVLDKGVEGAVCPVSGVRPVYPLGSRLRGEEGTVSLQVQVDASGSVDSVTVVKSSGYSGLDNAAVKAIRKTRFVPAMGRSGGVASETELSVRFQLIE